MAVPVTSTQFGDLLDERFQGIFDDRFKQLPDMIPTLFTNPAHNNSSDARWSQVGAFGDFSEFTGSVSYDDVAQGYDVTQTHIEFASGFQIERKLFADDQYNIMDAKPRGLAAAAQRTRQQHGAQVFTGAFSAGNSFYSHSEGVALCSNSHTTTADGVSTASGFDNLGTAALSHTAVVAARVQMRGFRDDRANRITVMPDELWYPPDLFDKAQEIMQSQGKPDTADNNVNVNQGMVRDGSGRAGWEYMTDTNDWFLVDSSLRSENLYWIDRDPLEFAFVEDFDTLVAKWRAYMRYSWSWIRWHWIMGHQVS